MYLKIGVRSSTFKNHLSLMSSHSKNSEASGQKEWKKFSKLSAKVDSLTIKTDKKIANDGGTQWCEDA